MDVDAAAVATVTGAGGGAAVAEPGAGVLLDILGRSGAGRCGNLIRVDLSFFCDDSKLDRVVSYRFRLCLNLLQVTSEGRSSERASGT
jgi:hypothetical protein